MDRFYQAGRDRPYHDRPAFASQTDHMGASAVPQRGQNLRDKATARFSLTAFSLRILSSRATGELLILGAIVLGLYLTSRYSYVLFHTLAEIYSVIIGSSMFILAWNSRHGLENDYLLFLGSAYLFVSGIDLVHALAYTGMGVFVGYDSDLPTQLWIAARYIQSISLLVSPLFLFRRSNMAGVLAGYAILTAILLTLIFTGLFPSCLIEGVGLTSFKIASEYIICLILLGSIAMLLRHRDQFDDDVLRWLIISLLLTVCSELVFTSYVNVYGFSNMLGHYLKIFAFSFIYKAIVEVGLEKPHRLLFRNLKQSETALRQVLQEVHRMAITDSLTGLHNRGHFFELAEHELLRAKRYSRPLSAVMLDIDHFKEVNDTYGHAIGDRVLRKVAEVCLRETRRVDVLGRYGGEEFAIMLPECEHPTARQVAERLRKSIAELAVETEAGPVQVTASFGVATLLDSSMTLDALFSAADGALYAAKRSGRDSVCSA